MPKLKQFIATLYPAKRTSDGLGTEIEICAFDSPRHPIEAATLDSMLEQLAAIAKEHGKPCAAFVHCREKRKPAGFDKATDRLYYNLDAEDKPEAACGNCNWTGAISDLNEIKDYHQRVAAGEAVPAGECPECGALAHIIKDEDRAAA